MIRMMKLIDLKPSLNEDAMDFGIENEELDGQPYEDHEGDMARAQLLSIHKQSGELFNMIGENDHLEGWVQAKLTKAADYINAVYNNMQYEKANVSSLGDGMGSPADADLTPVMENLDEEAPEGWEGTVKAMKDEPEIDNPWALAHWMKNKGYKSHKKEK